MAVTISDLNLNQALPVQLGEVAKYVVINDPDYPPLSSTVINGYDAFGNAISSVQVFPRTAKLVYQVDENDVLLSVPNPIQLSKVTNPVPLFNSNTDFPPLSTTVINGYDAFGDAIETIQVFPRTVELGFFGTVTSYLINEPAPLQLSEVTNYFPINQTAMNALSTVVVDGYDAFGNAISSVQIFPRCASLWQELSVSLPTSTNSPNPIQLSQVTNCVPVSYTDPTFYPLSTIVVNGYDAFGNALSSVQTFLRTASLVHILSPSTTLDVNAPLPIQLAQVTNYVPIPNDTSFPPLSTIVVNGYDAFGNALSSIQVFPRMVSLVYLVNP